MPACIPAIEVAHAKAVRVENNGVIVLADGRAARLEGVLLPAGTDDHAPRVFAERAIAALDDLVANRTIDLASTSPKEDRYDRIRAQVLAEPNGGDVWVQQELLRKGLARVAIAPDRDECVAELYAAEAGARAAKSGMWSSSAYAILMPGQAQSKIGTFQIVEGTVNSVSSSGGRIFLDFASDEGARFVGAISPADMKRFHEIGVDPYAYANDKVRVRGWIDRFHGMPEIPLATPGQIEVVQTEK